MSCQTCGGGKLVETPEGVKPCHECRNPLYWLEKISQQLEQQNSEPAFNSLARINLYRSVIATDSFPIGFQVNRKDVFASLLSISPGLLAWSAAGQNATTGLRLYRGQHFQEEGWQSGYAASDINQQELEHEQLCSVATIIPWERSLTFFVEFSFLNNPPVGSILRGTIRPFRQ